MKTMFRTGWGTEIEELEVIKTSNKSVWFKWSNGREDRELFKTNYYAWFNTKKEARDVLIKKYTHKVAGCRDSLNHAQENLDSLLKELDK